MYFILYVKNCIILDKCVLLCLYEVNLNILLKNYFLFKVCMCLREWGEGG